MQLLALKVGPVNRFSYFSFSGVFFANISYNFFICVFSCEDHLCNYFSCYIHKRPCRVATLGDLKLKDFVRRADNCEVNCATWTVSLSHIQLKYVTNANFSVKLRLNWVKSVDIELTLHGDFVITKLIQAVIKLHFHRKNIHCAKEIEIWVMKLVQNFQNKQSFLFSFF